ncbi:PAS domain S-box protein [Maribacter algarum]|uniref:histidine kinase n=1 Tax=Maribacter algarum (ex Zhang et al. 2020) TaxID=2578118 RepID=A0A5S3PTR0_9FLAO|nr:PAS domain S-box protein [Maribacter algarum]TMM56080.1 PAS domain S-box protein [Maribacter algarum]
MLKGSQKSTNNYLIKQLPKATVFVDKRKAIVYMSDKWLNDFELYNSVAIGKNIISLFKNSNPEWQKSISQCLKGLPNLTLTESHQNKNGNKKWFELHSTPWYDENENIIGTILQAEDITLRVSTETKLEKLEIISEDISDMAEIGFWDYNLAEDKMFWDSRTKGIHEVADDYIPNFIETSNFYKLGHSRNTISMTVNRAITKEVPFSEKLQLITAKGNEIWVIVSGKPLYKKGKFSGMVGTIQNINERHLNEVRTKENQRLLRTLIDNLPLSVSIKDLESRRILVNKSEMDFCNVQTEKEIIGKDDFSFFDKARAEITRKDDLSVMRDRKPILRKEVNHKEENGDLSTYLISKIPLIDTDEHAYGLVSIRMNISDIKQKEIELRKLIDVTSSQNEKLINFAHIVSHNLRSHSANFSMLLDFLASEKSEPEKEKIMQMLLDASDNLLETLDNLNEVVHITTNTSLQKKYIQISKKIEAVQQNLGAELEKHKIKVINTIKDHIKVRVVPAYIDSILTNFMTNGIKYRSPERDSFIKLSATVEGNYTVLHIEDNGLGIDLDKYGEKLFGMYKTFHNNKDAKGIGLYITKNQIEAMRGKVTVDSKVGQGTTFKIYFNDKD